ncbi:nuclear transport factor 2 family protein [Dyadobacter psychrophilus]|uniref:DUF4440 domain-containing protein n=1 Tax=Dyadobacter psychrophilus TaxID=651661 RepID=A0A1T5ER24_9BACT|nr:nuclear transport factor 2 family protein [Dyadobacter psychrophilus]SKB86413.1 protein of unknown function [Dyadobacter psychrophilus]
MNNIFWIVLLLGSMDGSTLTEKKIMQQNTTNDQAAVLDTVRKLAQLMIARDTAAMNNILDEHYTLTHMTGYVQSKSEWFGEVQKETMKYYSAQEVSHSVKVTGNQAEVTVQNRVDARIWGSRNTWRLQQKVQLEKRNGKWIILKSVASTF